MPIEYFELLSLIKKCIENSVLLEHHLRLEYRCDWNLDIFTFLAFICDGLLIVVCILLALFWELYWLELVSFVVRLAIDRLLKSI